MTFNYLKRNRTSMEPPPGVGTMQQAQGSTSTTQKADSTQTNAVIPRANEVAQQALATQTSAAAKPPPKPKRKDSSSDSDYEILPEIVHILTEGEIIQQKIDALYDDNGLRAVHAFLLRKKDG